MVLAALLLLEFSAVLLHEFLERRCSLALPLVVFGRRTEKETRTLCPDGFMLGIQRPPACVGCAQRPRLRPRVLDSGDELVSVKDPRQHVEVRTI